MREPETLYEAAAAVQAFCQERGWRFCFIGGLAVLRWGRQRLTTDVDLTLLTGFGGEPPYVRSLIERFPSRVSDPEEFARRNRVVVVTAGSVEVDIGLGALPFEERSVQRASPYAYESDLTLVTCSAEDLAVHKVFAGRPQDWLDVEGIVMARGQSLDRDLIWSELEPLIALHDDPEPRRRDLTAIFEKWPP